MVGTTEMNPLHITCSCQRASVEVVKVLLKDVPLNLNGLYEYEDNESASINSSNGNGHGHGNGSESNKNNDPISNNDAKDLNNASQSTSSASSNNNNSKPLTSTMVTTSMKDVDGDTPLHAACRCGAPIEVLKVLLQANPAVVHDRDYEGLTPLLRLWVRYFVTLGDDVINLVINEVSDREDVATKGNGILAEAWKKTELLLRAAYYGSVEPTTRSSSTLTIAVAETDRPRNGGVKIPSSDDQDNQDNNYNPTTTSLEQDLQFLAIHAAASVDCPRAVVKIATVLYPHQLEEFDSSFRTPLMIAASTPIYKEHDLSGEGYSLEELIHGEDEDGEYYDGGGCEGGGGESSSDDSDSHPTEQKQPTVLQILLDAGANARNGHDNFHQGRIPLHQTILSGKRWHEGVKVMRNAFPDGLIKADKETGLFAFMLAASLTLGKSKLKEDILSVENRKDLNTIFELLRSRPEALCVRK
uniref:Uncharacterized protein n=2 Tax=Chaetoceros debilis TaxID=122233 RepID=A0A6S8Y2V5_9STRA